MVHSDFCKQFIPEGGVVLDVGSGRGKFLCIMASLGFKAYGVEINSAYIAESENRAKSEGVSIKVVQSGGEELPFPDNYFDFVNCTEVTEHVDDPMAVCREIGRVLKPGSHAYISFHNRFGIYDYHYHLWGINWLPRAWTGPILFFLGKAKEEGVGIGRQTLTSMHYFLYSQIKKIITNNGFTFTDTREEKIKKYFPVAALFLLPFYRRLARPIAFNSFHLLLTKHSS
ncbi:MAG: Methyltransferase type 11 [Candidatus Peregrinibacteria bacterium GW2011_GWC2_39_14]|nr:MAG: Methyltransferase type 11 [Candidatus Peregrinibacteria bacterium GW2011_GWC2_39_14]